MKELEQDTDQQAKRYILRRSIMDIGMGVIYISIGFVIFFAEKLGLHNEFGKSIWAKFFAGLFMLYGIWRIYRGIKKDYLIER